MSLVCAAVGLSFAIERAKAREEILMDEQRPGTHGETRGGYAPRSLLRQGRFGRMFRQLPPCPCDEPALIALAAAMIEPTPPPSPPNDPYGRNTGDNAAPGPDNPAVPAGYTYLGQFLDHDVTFDPTSHLQQLADPDSLVDFRTPALDLDSVYGAGPADQPYLYEADGLRFAIEAVAEGEFDVPRSATGRALIGDPRNDVHLIISQLHLLFCSAHNRLVDRLVDEGVGASALFEAARRELTWTYQRIVLDDYLPRISGTSVVDDVFQRQGTNYQAGAGTPSAVPLPRVERLFYRWRHSPFMPVEFSGAIFRIGHSQIRPEYKLNEPLGPRPLFDNNVLNSLLGFRRRPPGWTVDWPLFFEVNASTPQLSRRIDTNIADPMLNLPAGVATDPPSVALRNLLRGCTYQLPCGQDVALAMGLTQIAAADIANTGATEPLTDHTPLWYYVLAEAEIVEQGKHLGPLGGRLFAEVVTGLIEGDDSSFLHVNPNWQPKHIAQATPGRVTVADLINFVA